MLRTLRIAVAALFVTAACTITLPQLPGQQTSTPLVATGAYPTVQAALQILVDQQVNRPTSDQLLAGAAKDMFAFLQKQGLTTAAAAPTFTGNVNADLAAYSAFLDAVIAGTGGVTKSDLESASVTGMAATTNECHTYYLEPTRAQSFNQPGPEQYSGIGARIGQTAPNTQSLPEITQVFPGSPAESAGIKAGDRVKNVDGKDVAGLTAEEVAKLIRGPEATQVSLTLVRNSVERQLQVTRATLRPPAIYERLVGDAGEFGYVGINVSTLSASTPRDLADTLGRLDAAGARAWVLDLRGDPGGLLDSAELVASTFIKTGFVLYEVGRDGQVTPRPVNQKAFYPRTKPLAVLVDHGTASGAEIIASAIQEHQVGRIFGETTAGCLSIGQPRELPDGGLLLYTFAKIQSGVARQDLTNRGIVPDEPIQTSPDDASDKVLDAAVAWLKTQ